MALFGGKVLARDSGTQYAIRDIERDITRPQEIELDVVLGIEAAQAARVPIESIAARG